MNLLTLFIERLKALEFWGRVRSLEFWSADSLGRMSAHVIISDSDLEIARLEEAKRRHDVMVRFAVL